MIANMSYRCMLLVEKWKLRKSSIQPNLGDVHCKTLQRAREVEYALYNYILYGYNSTRALIGCFPVMTKHYFLVMTEHYKLGVLGIYNLWLTWWWRPLLTSMLWSIDSCRKEYPLTSVMWLYRGLKCTTHWDDVFFLSYPLTSCWF